jgi:hypothetical protein
VSTNTTLTECLSIDTELPIDESDHGVEPREASTLPQAAAKTDTTLQAAPPGTQEPAAHAFQVRLADPPADVPPAPVVAQLADASPAAQAESQSALEEAQPAAET